MQGILTFQFFSLRKDFIVQIQLSTPLLADWEKERNLGLADYISDKPLLKKYLLLLVSPILIAESAWEGFFSDSQWYGFGADYKRRIIHTMNTIHCATKQINRIIRELDMEHDNRLWEKQSIEEVCDGEDNYGRGTDEEPKATENSGSQENSQEGNGEAE